MCVCDSVMTWNENNGITESIPTIIKSAFLRKLKI